MPRFDLLDEYASIVSPAPRKNGGPDWPERFDDSQPGVPQERSKREGPAILSGLVLIILAGAAAGLLGKGFF